MEKIFQTDSAIEVKPLYTPEDMVEAGFDHSRDLGSPGRYPFTRGKDSTGYRKNPWIMYQYAGFGSAEETNKRYHFLLDHGETGLSVAIDLPTQIGYDSDNPLASGEVGKVGVPISSLQDAEVLFKGIPLDRPRQISATFNSNAPIWLAMMIVLAEKQGISPQKIGVRIQNDILKEYIARGTYIFPSAPSVSMATDVIAYCAEHHPNWFPLTACGYHIREAGANAAQEIAFTLANAIAYIDDTVRKGVKPEKFISKIPVFFSCGMDFFEEIAKFRTMRRLWSRTMKERYHIDDPNLLSLNLVVFTAGSALTAQQPMNNIVRVAVQTLASAIGGCQNLHTCSMDEAYCTPTEEAVKLALRTQQIIAHETGIVRTIDPLGGSYFIESLSNKLEEIAKNYLREIDETGGAVKATESGYFQRQISKSAYELNRQIEEKERIVVGVNEYVDDTGLPIEILKVDPGLERKQIDSVRALKKERDNVKVKQALRELKRVAEIRENIVPPCIEAVRAYATVGEICDVLREVYGEYTGASHF
ncbi:MAG: methylmalonyl-CoA mutase [Chloroflexi bacterium]|nr:methylmalonyl-CoA mutase [Chloroflexota bacterium]